MTSPYPMDPVYMTYVTRHNQDLPAAPTRRESSPYRPATGLTHTDLQLQTGRYSYQHFHRPHNDHSRFLAVASSVDRNYLRDIPRTAPPPWDGSTPDYDMATRRRPTSAPLGSAYATPERVRGSSPRRPSPNTAPRRISSPGGSPDRSDPEAAAAQAGGGGYVGGGVDVAGATLLDNMTTRTGRPVYSVTALLEADIVDGEPLLGPEDVARWGPDEVAWRMARVQTYEVPPSPMGYGDGGARPFHQDYRHYKYYGFAGHGAKTSWAHNPKYNRIYGDVFSAQPGAASSAATMTLEAPPLQPAVGGPRRALTPAEKALVAQFKWHNYGAEGVPTDPEVSDVLANIAAGRSPSPETLRHLQLKHRRVLGMPASPAPRTPTHTAAAAAAGAQQHRPQWVQPGVRTPRGGAGAEQQQRHSTHRSSGGGAGTIPAATGLPHSEIIEPFDAKVDLESRTPLPSKTRIAGNARAARVVTYRQLASPSAGEYNRSPQHGSQSPWHQRYSHYRYAGFAGRGASSSWARNPKYAYMYDS